MTPITVLPGSLPPGYCYPGGPGGPQQYNVDIVTRISAFLNQEFPGIFVGPDAPPVDQRDRIWFNTRTLREYWFVNGNWFRTADTLAGPNGLLMPWKYSELSLWSFDGGDGSDPRIVSPTLYTGAVWQVDHTLDGKFLVGAGTLQPSTAVIAQGDTGGQDQVSLAVTQMPSHTHFEVAEDDVIGGPTPATQLSESWPGVYSLAGSTKDATVAKSAPTGGDPSATPPYSKPVATPTIPPYSAIFWAQRTIRQFVTT